ncbi:hypothetical protein [Sphingomonas bacterium]|nr:hypothetical protein [Sphingomonas bacterium]
MAAHQQVTESKASLARKQGLSPARGLLNGLLFTIGLWLGLTGLALLILH